MRFKLIIIYFLLFVCSLSTHGQKKSIQANTDRKDSTLSNRSSLVSIDTPKSDLITKSEYYELLEKTIEHKQQFYDSSLNTLNFWAAIIGVLIGIITLIFVIVAFMGFSKVKDIQTHIEDGLDSKIGKKVTDKYEADISEIKSRLGSLENEDNSLNNHNQVSPTPFSKNESNQTSTNPFDQQ